MSAPADPALISRANTLFAIQHENLLRALSRLFVALLTFEFLGGIATACWISPRTWEGLHSELHPHLFVAAFLGLAIVSLPIFFALRWPLAPATAHILAAGQMLMGGLLIHLNGGRIETHFLIFGSLAFLAFFLDWKVLITASVLTFADHLLRGMFWPQSIFGTAAISNWRWLEHAGYVAFEDIFLIAACTRGLTEMRGSARRQASLEIINAQATETARLLAENEQVYRFMADAMPQIVWTATPEGLIDYSNQRLAEFTGLSAEEGKGWGWTAIIHADDLQRCMDHWTRSIRTGQPYQIEYRMKSRTGVYRWHLGRAFARRDAEGRITQWVGTSTDIDEQKNIESALQHSRKDLEVRVAERTNALVQANEALTTEIAQRARTEESLRNADALLHGVLGSSLDGVMAFRSVRNEIGRIVDFEWLLTNESAQRMVRRSANELLGHHLLLTFPGHKADGLFDRYVSVVETGQSLKFEHYYDHDGFQLWLLISAVRLGDGFSVTFSDITAAKQAEEALRRSEELSKKLALVASRTVNAVVIKDAAGNVEWVNEAFVRITGYELDEVIGKKMGDLLHGAHTDLEVVLRMRSAIERGEGYQEELACYRKTGQEYWISIDCQPVYDDQGKLRNFIAIELDITARKHQQIERESMTRSLVAALADQGQMTSELAAAREAADTANAAKSAFLANMSHEIRTPLTAIAGYSEMLAHPEDGAVTHAECVHVIRRNSRHLQDLINDILDLSKIEAGKMSVDRSWCDLPQLLCDLASMLRPRAIEKGLKFAVTFAGPIPRHIHTDPLRLKQILMNLVSNATKFTGQGEVSVAVSCQRETARTSIRFDITDSGIGISPDQLQRLFLPFSQADESTTRKFGGTGLGLNISRKLALLLGGNIAVDSRHGEGSTFSLTIDAGAINPCDLVDEFSEMLKPAPAQPAKTFRLNGRILLAEDGPDNRLLIVTHLRNAGATVDVAENGRIAVEKVRAGNFDLVLMDMQMPELDGYGATAQLRKEGILIPIVALTANAMSEDRQKCLDSGCTDYLAKPIDRDLLLSTVASYLTRNAAPIPDSPPTLKSDFANDDVISPLIPQFVAGLPERVNQLVASLTENDLQSLRSVAHQLKGTAGGFGFDPVSEFARKIDEGIRLNAQVDQITQDVDALVNVVRSIDGYDPSLETRPPESPRQPSPLPPKSAR